jgi:anti-sigma factor RsiW
MSELTCKEVVELVTDYLSKAMPEAERLRFDAHLADCDACTVHIQQMRTTIELTGRLDGEALSEQAKRDLLAAFRHWKK